MKSYGQWCSLATALDVVGERWSLLVVRELFDGPKRYTDLRDGIPGIATDVLASRLRDLEDHGIVAKRELPPPAASKVYELTPLGLGLGPTMTELMKWGSQLLGPKTPDLEFRPHWLVLGLKGMLRPNRAADVRLDVDFDIGSGEVIRVHVEDGRLSHVAAPETAADVVVHGDLTVLTAIADGTVRIPEAMADGRFAMDGDADAVASFQRLFPQPRAVPSRG
jgi:DNA-binding HxlR family transcriptional regulator